MTTLHLIRHGQASFGADDYDCLSELGVKQSRLLGEWMLRCGETPTRIVIGPMLRHRQTADACMAALADAAALTAETLPGFAEFDHLDVLGRFRPELSGASALRDFLEASKEPRVEFQSVFRGAMQRWLDAHEDDYVESWSMFKRRCIDALTQISESAAVHDKIWVITSGGPIAVIVQHLLEIPDTQLVRFSGTLANSGVTRVHRGHDGLRIGAFNVAAHLESAGEAGLVTYR